MNGSLETIDLTGTGNAKLMQLINPVTKTNLAQYLEYNETTNPVINCASRRFYAHVKNYMVWARRVESSPRPFKGSYNVLSPLSVLSPISLQRTSSCVANFI